MCFKFPGNEKLQREFVKYITQKRRPRQRFDDILFYDRVLIRQISNQIRGNY